MQVIKESKCYVKVLIISETALQIHILKIRICWA